MHKKFKWGAFEKLKGWDGLNNAAINTFNSNIVNSFIREMFQNSNDARQRDNNDEYKKLIIEIDYLKIPKTVFPKYNELLSIIEKISEEPENWRFR